MDRAALAAARRTEAMRTEFLGTSYLALPDGPAPYPGVVVVHEASGLNDNIRGICRRFAAEGYAALGVDLFEGRNRAACMARMFIGGMAGNLNYYGVPALKAALGRLAGHPEVDAARIGAIGFCLGGSTILTWACTDRRLDAIAPFYGAAPKPREAIRRLCRVVGSWPGKDFTTKSAGVLEADLTAAGIPHDLKVYPGAKHSFFNDQWRNYQRRRRGLLAAGPGLLRRARPGQPGRSRLTGGCGANWMLSASAGGEPECIFCSGRARPRGAIVCGRGDGQAERAGPLFSSWRFNSVQILRSIRLPRGRTSGLNIRIQPFGCTCQSQPITVPSPSAAKVSAPEVSIIELVVREPIWCGRSNAVNSTSISVPALPMRARNSVPSPIGSGVSNSTRAMAGLNDGSLRESETVSNTCSTGAAMRT